MKIFTFMACLLLTIIVQAQSLVISPGTDFTITSGTVMQADNLALTPAADFTLNGNALALTTTVVHFTQNPYIARVYRFVNGTNPFTGTIQINYNDGAELNGIPETSLTLNVHDGNAWRAYAVATRDPANNFVLTNGVTAVSLEEMTLGDVLGPLPVLWLSFTVTGQDHKALLQWSTAQEQNTRDFIIEHSTNTTNWTSIGKVAAAGNSNSTSNYSYVHNSPANGNNYYRLLQTDIDNRTSYSDVKVLRVNDINDAFVLMENPVNNHTLRIQANTSALLAFYTSDGKLLWQRQVNAGPNSIDVGRYANGVYLLKMNSTLHKIIIQ